MADMLCDDLAIARETWIQDDDEKIDFLNPTNDAGERLDFHALATRVVPGWGDEEFIRRRFKPSCATAPSH
jgi:hypothetical protein